MVKIMNYLLNHHFLEITSYKKDPISMPIIVTVASITALALCVISFVLWRRKKLYGGFYILSYPPLPDYMGQLDITKDIQEQLRRLPFISEWEFPRERIALGKYLHAEDHFEGENVTNYVKRLAALSKWQESRPRKTARSPSCYLRD